MERRFSGLVIPCKSAFFINATVVKVCELKFYVLSICDYPLSLFRC